MNDFGAAILAGEMKMLAAELAERANQLTVGGYNVEVSLERRRGDPARGGPDFLWIPIVNVLRTVCVVPEVRTDEDGSILIRRGTSMGKSTDPLVFSGAAAQAATPPGASAPESGSVGQSTCHEPQRPLPGGD